MFSLLSDPLKVRQIYIGYAKNICNCKFKEQESQGVILRNNDCYFFSLHICKQNMFINLFYPLVKSKMLQALGANKKLCCV